MTVGSDASFEVGVRGAANTESNTFGLCGPPWHRAPWQPGSVGGRRPSFVDALPAPARVRLEGLGSKRTLGAGSVLLLEGDIANRVWIVECGLLKVTSLRSDGQESILALRGPGDVVGELATLDGGQRSGTVTAVIRSELQSLSGQEFLDFLSTEPDAALALIRELVGRLRDADQLRVSHASDDVPTRLASCLLEIAESHGRSRADGSVEIDLPLTQVDLAGLVGSSRDAVARSLQRWRSQGLVATARRRIILLDADRLTDRYRHS